MNEQQRKQVIVFTVLAVVLVAVLVYQFKGGSPKPSPAASTATTAAAGTAATAPSGATSAAPAATTGTQKPESVMKKAEVNIDELLTGIKEVDFDYDGERTARDPLAPLIGTASKKGEEEKVPDKETLSPAISHVMSKVITGILWDKVRPLAVVDNEVVYPGYEYPDGVRVERVEKTAVIFKVGDSEIQVELKEL